MTTEENADVEATDGTVEPPTDVGGTDNASRAR